MASTQKTTSRKTSPRKVVKFHQLYSCLYLSVYLSLSPSLFLYLCLYLYLSISGRRYRGVGRKTCFLKVV